MSATGGKEKPRPGTVTLYLTENGRCDRAPCRVMTHWRNLTPLSAALAYLAGQLGAPVGTLHDTRGALVTSPTELRADHCYVAVPRGGRFTPGPYRLACVRHFPHQFLMSEGPPARPAAWHEAAISRLVPRSYEVFPAPEIHKSEIPAPSILRPLRPGAKPLPTNEEEQELTTSFLGL